MWVIFIASSLVIAIIALVVVMIGYKVYLSIRRQNKNFELEEELYNKAKSEIKKGE